MKLQYYNHLGSQNPFQEVEISEFPHPIDFKNNYGETILTVLLNEDASWGFHSYVGGSSLLPVLQYWDKQLVPDKRYCNGFNQYIEVRDIRVVREYKI